MDKISIEEWTKIVNRGKGCDDCYGILESWQLDRSMFQIIVDDLKHQLNIEWMKGYNDGLKEGRQIHE